jgi:hypothetical protein
LLTKAEYEVRNTTDPAAFMAENTSGNNRISDIGGSMCAFDGIQWVLVGIMSKKAIQSAGDDMNKMFTFSNAAHHCNWMKNHNSGVGRK